MIKLLNKVMLIREKVYGLIFLLAMMSNAWLYAQTNFSSNNAIAQVEQKFLMQRSTQQATFASNNYRIHFSRFFWKVNPAVRYIDATVIHHFTTRQNTNNLVFDFTTQLTVDSILFRNQKINFVQNSNQSLSINLGTNISNNQKDSVAIYYHGVPDNTGFGSFIQDQHNGVPVIWTLSEPYGCKDWWPCRNGLDEKIDSIDIYVTHPTQYKASCNGLLQYERTDGLFTTTFFKHRYPIASYLIAIAVTNYATFNTTINLRNTALPFTAYAYPENITSFITDTYKLVDAMKLFDSTFIAYPFMKEKYGHTQFGWGGGMEHQTNSFLTHTDANLIAHELAHQWFGNLITCGSWQDIWLNEGFATFSSSYYFEKKDTANYRRFIENQLNEIVAAPDGSVFVRDTSNPYRIFNGRLSYNKASHVLRMLRFTMGDSIFFSTLRQYLQDTSLQFKFAKTQQFKAIAESVFQQDLTWFFNQWIYGEGYPTFTVQWKQNSNQWTNFTVQQTTSHSSVSFFKTLLPLIFKKGNTERTIVVNCTEPNQNFWADIGFMADTVLIDKNLWLISKNNQSIKATNNNTAANEVTVYPNPATTTMQISVKNPTDKQLTISVYNTAGQQFFKQVYATPGNDELFTILTSNWPKGMYLIRLSNNNGLQLTKKVIR